MFKSHYEYDQNMLFGTDYQNMFSKEETYNGNTNYWSQNQRHQQNISSLSPSQRTISSLSPPAAVVDGTFKEEQKPVRNRISFSKKQLLALEKEFAKNTHPTRGRIMELAVHLHLTERRVRVWYTNRRSKYRRNVQKECDRNSFEGYHRNVCFNDQSLPSLNNILFPSNEQNPEPIPPRTQEIRTPRKFSQNQLVAMEKEFAKIINPPRHRLIELANSLELTEQRVKIWFKNRRSKDIKNCKNQNIVKDNLQHAVIATTVMDKIEKTDIAEPIQQNVCFPNSFDGYGGNFNLDQQLNNHYFSNSFPFNDNQNANYIDYVGPAYQGVEKKQYPNPPITDTFFNYDGGIHYNTLNHSKYESTNLYIA